MQYLPAWGTQCTKPISRSHLALLEFLHRTPRGSKLGSYMPNMAVNDLNKIQGVVTLYMCRAIFVYTVNNFIITVR